MACTGDIRTLLDYENYNTVNTSNARFCYLFNYCKQLTSAPKLPATELADNCYSVMFNGCTSLTTAPELKATTLANRCYSTMFRGCTSLTTAPKLPATTLAYYCYSNMFDGCTSLTTAPELKATTLANYCYSNMFNGCKKLKSVTMLATDGFDKSDCLYKWLNSAGTDDSVTQRTLKVASQGVYTNIVSNLPDNWKIGASNTTVIDQNGNILSSSSTAP